ncbi:MAG: hypothetical protein J7L57_01530 [Deltaproteobacteria bacterium]|nr:hypothetical protein [Candidatus Tharpella sp.]
MKKIIISLVLLVYALSGKLVVSAAFSAVEGKGFSIVYSSDERGAIIPCG